MTDNPALLTKPKTRNAHTQAAHQRELFWQIGLPCAVAVLVAVGLMGLIAFSPDLTMSRSPLADVSLMFLIIPTALWGIVALAVLISLCAGLIYLLRELPYWAKQVQEFMWLTAHETKRYTGYIGDSVVSVRAWLAGGQKTLDVLRSIFIWRRRS